MAKHDYSYSMPEVLPVSTEEQKREIGIAFLREVHQESRSRHEQFRSSMFSTSRGFTPALTHAGSGSAGGGGSVDSEKPDRIEAAILAGMAVDAQRGTHTFNTVAITPAHSGTGSPAYHRHDHAAYYPRGGPGRVNGGGGNPNVAHNAMSQPGAQHDGYYGDGGGGGYKTYHPPSGGSGGGGNGYPSHRVPLDGSGQSGSLTRSDGSHGAGLNESGGGGVGVRGSSGGGGGSGGGGSGSSVSDVFRYSGEKPPQPSPHQHQHRADSGDTPGRGGMSGSSAGGGSNERRRRPAGGAGSGGENKRSVWRHDSPAAAGGGADGGREPGRGAIALQVDSDSSEPADDRRRQVSGQEAFGAPDWDVHVMPVEAGSGDMTLADGDSGRIALTPTEYEEPLELPDGCHHISLSKFLEVMTGPGLRVRKHHRAGKGSSGLRVLRYAPDEDSLTWDSHKILGAAQHVLPMADIKSVSMQSGNRVVLTCVGGRDSYAVFEAANNDAGAVLYVGLERLRKRTVS